MPSDFTLVVLTLNRWRWCVKQIPALSGRWQKDPGVCGPFLGGKWHPQDYQMSCVGGSTGNELRRIIIRIISEWYTDVIKEYKVFIFWIPMTTFSF